MSVDLKKILSPESYKIFAGPDWPSYQDVINGKKSGIENIDQEINEYIKDRKIYYEKLFLSREVLSTENQKRQNQLFFDKKFPVGTINGCRVPWQTLGINSNGDCYICQSPSWIPIFVGNIREVDDIFDILNNKKSRLIRQEILSGRYYYCNNKICGFFSKVSPKKYQDLRDGIEHIPLDEKDLTDASLVTELPRNLIFDFDYTCNFQCPSCRTDVINWNKDFYRRPVNDEIVEKIKKLIIDVVPADYQLEIRWCGGEPFISDVYNDLLMYIVKSNKTGIKSIIQTNGSYIGKKHDDIKSLLPYLKEIWVSFDAAKEDTYKKIRVNGVWENLISNSRLLREMVDSSESKPKLLANFVVQLDNYVEIPDFVALCDTLRFDGFTLQKMWNWGTWPDEIFKEKNIYDQTHPLHNDLRKYFELAGLTLSY